MGFNLFVLQKESGQDIGFITWAAMPFLLILLFATAVLTVFPGIVLWLPERMLGS